METNIEGQSPWSRMVAHWQPAVLVAVCVAGGLTLTTMVIGSTPDVVVQASQAAIEAAPVDTPASDAPVVAEVVVDTAPSTTIVDPAAADAASVAPGTASAAWVEPATVVTPAPGPSPAVPSVAPTTAQTAGLPSTPAPAPVVTSAPVAPVTTTAPQTSAAPTTAAPPPTTASSPPTTAASVAALTYPSFSAGSAATVVLQFDGSSISVASVTRQTNWVSQVDQNGPRTVEIKFFNTVTQQDEEFHATVENGRIKVEN